MSTTGIQYSNCIYDYAYSSLLSSLLPSYVANTFPDPLYLGEYCARPPLPGEGNFPPPPAIFSNSALIKQCINAVMYSA